jgi:hypothetical protein
MAVDATSDVLVDVNALREEVKKKYREVRNRSARQTSFSYGPLPCEDPTSAPVSTNPLGSSATPDPESQSVFGSAPMKRNRWRMGRRTSTPDQPCRQRT